MEKEFIEIRKILKSKRNAFETAEAFDISLDDFFEEIYQEKPHIIHFSGYGTDNDIILSKKSDRKQYAVRYEFLASAFKLIRDNTECVFINTQGSALFAKVISRFIPYAIGIKGIVMDDEAISFSSGFYAALAIEKDYEKAFKNGKELFLAQKKRIADLLQKEQHMVSKEINDKKTDTASIPIESDYYLYKNGYSEEDTTSPDDFLHGL